MLDPVFETYVVTRFKAGQRAVWESYVVVRIFCCPRLKGLGCNMLCGGNGSCGRISLPAVALLD